MLSDMLLYLVCKDLLPFDLMKIVSWKLPHYYGTLSFFILAFHTIIHELMLIDGDMYKFCNVTEKQFAFDGNRKVARSISFSKKFIRSEIIEDMEQNLNQMINFNMIFIQSGVEITSILRNDYSVKCTRHTRPNTKREFVYSYKYIFRWTTFVDHGL